MNNGSEQSADAMMHFLGSYLIRSFGICVGLKQEHQNFGKHQSVILSEDR